MLSGSLSDSSVAYNSKQLTLDDVHKLQEIVFDEKTHVIIHGEMLEGNALLLFCRFLKTVKCSYITVYFENMDYQTALAIYKAVMKNRHRLKAKLDLGEQFLGYFSAYVLNNAEVQDIFDHLICGIYKNVQCLALHCRSINYFQVDKLFTGLDYAPLKKLIMRFDWLDELVIEHFKQVLLKLQITKEIQLLINGIEQLQAPAIESAPAPVLLQAATSSSSSFESEPDLEVEANCWHKTLTWMMSKLSCSASTEDVEPDEPTVAHYKLS